MQGTEVINAKLLLQHLLDRCSACKKRFDENVLLIVDNENNTLSEDQVDFVLAKLLDGHREH